MKKLYAFLLAVLVTACAFAQAPSKMTYQAVIRNSSNQLVTSQAVGMRISILQGSVSGTVVYSETLTPVTNANGLVSVEIGGAAGFTTINWANGPYFIKTETDPAGGTNYTITGTSQLLSVPYALHSRSAETADYNNLTNLPTLNSSNWNTAFGWGNHAGLYRPISYVPAWGEITGKPTTVAGYGITDAHDNWGTQTVVADATLSGDGSAAKPLKIAQHSATTGQVLKWNGTTWLPAADLTGGSGWLLTGNAGTSASSNFIGTTDDVPLSIKVNNMLSGKIDRLLYNTSFGYQSLSSNTTGLSNTAFGDEALYLNTTGYNNTSLGHKALVSNTTGSSNTAVGTTALSSNNIGKDNTSIGNSALRFNDTGNENNAVGMKALFFNSSGSGNIAFGTAALGLNSTGSLNTAVGTRSLYSNDKNSRSTAIGVGAMYNADDNTTTVAHETYNTAVGYEALKGSNTAGNNTGERNTAVGDQAMYANTAGNSNSAFGNLALYSNTVGTWNTATGSSALYSNTIGSNNTAFGSSSLYWNTLGVNNSANGFASLNNNTVGNWNSATGAVALFYNTEGCGNTADGFSALYSNTIGSENSATGAYALYGNMIGSKNSATGAYALFWNSEGTHNTANGYNALYYNTTGSENTASGANALKANTIGNFNTANGMHALIGNTTGYYNTALGRYALSGNTIGYYNTGIGCIAGDNNQTGSFITCIGYDADVSDVALTNATAIGANALVNASNKIILGNANATTVGGYGNWANYSDRRLKENILYKNDLGLNFITRLKTVSFNYTADDNKRRRDGLVAQDVQQVLKDLKLDFSGLVVDDDKEKTLNLSYGDFVVPLINAVQEQQKLIMSMQKTIEQLQLRVEQFAGK